MLQVTQVTSLVPPTAHASLDLVAIAGIAGTLLGTALGAWTTWLVQRRQLQHEDLTRFHDRRLHVYAEFNDACNKVIAAVGSTRPLPIPDIARVISSYEMLRLVASKPVATAAAPVHAAIGAVAAMQVTNPAALTAQFNADLAVLCNAMRTEIGVAV